MFQKYAFTFLCLVSFNLLASDSVREQAYSHKELKQFNLPKDLYAVLTCVFGHGGTVRVTPELCLQEKKAQEGAGRRWYEDRHGLEFGVADNKSLESILEEYKQSNCVDKK